MMWFTSDTHFGADSENILTREMRPFNNVLDYAKFQIAMWNKQATADDVIYVIGDFCNLNKKERDWYMGLQIVKQINASVVLITGNSEERVIASEFNNNFEAFKKFCIDLGFLNVRKDLMLTIRDKQVYLNHFPSKHKEGYINLFGHTHRATGIWKPYGLNVGTDLNHFRLYSEDDLFSLLQQKEDWWDNDIDNNCMK